MDIFLWKCLYIAAVYLSFLYWKCDAERNVSRLRGSHSYLMEDLLRNYGPTTARPVVNNSHVITVFFSLTITQVIELNERDQTLRISANMDMRWRDEYLTWDKRDYPDVDRLNLPVKGIWRPDINLYQNVDKDFEHVKEVTATVTPGGNVTWMTPVILLTSCRIDARFFPFDTQHCELKFASWSYGMNKVDLQILHEQDERVEFVENGVWELNELRVNREERHCCEYPYAEIEYMVLLDRRPMFHVLSVILPSVLLSLMNLMVFMLPTESGEKVSLGITNLLALVLFQQLIGDSLPPTTDFQPIITYYFTPMIVIGCLSVVAGVCVAYLHHHIPSRAILCNESSASKQKAKILVVNHDSKGNYMKPFENPNEIAVDDLVRTTDSPVNTREGFHTNANDDMDNYPISGSVPHSDLSDIIRRLHNGSHVCPTCGVTSKDGVGSDRPLGGTKRDWKKTAATVDRCMFLVCFLLTISSMIITVILFFITTDEHLEEGGHSEGH